jgi:hypothetical protein
MQDLTFAARMQHRIYWGNLKPVLEWSLKTWLAPWSYVSSVVYHDWLWYPTVGKAIIRRYNDTPWGRLFKAYASDGTLAEDIT